MVCHNDVCLENVVFRGGAAVALLDFEFAAPEEQKKPLHRFVDISARDYEVGRQPRTAAKFLARYRERVLFGTDMERDRPREIWLLPVLLLAFECNGIGGA